MAKNKNDNNKDYNCYEKLILRYSDISAISLFMSPFMFLGLLKLGELRTHIPKTWENYIYGLILVFIIPFTIGIMVCLLKINIKQEVPKMFIAIIMLLAFVFYGGSYFFIYFNKSSNLTGWNVFFLALFSLINPGFIIYILKSIFMSIKNWVFKIDDNKG